MTGIAIIGLGTVGMRYVEQYQAHEGFNLIGGFDVSTSACDAAADRFGLAIFDSAEELITAADVVYVAVPPLYHRQYVDLTIDAGKALLCEKPLGVDDAESQAMVARVADTDSRAAVNFVFGAAPSASKLVADVALSGDTIHGIDLRVHFEQWPRAWQTGAAWLRDRDQGGWAREVISHYVFLLLRLCGEVTVESCTAMFPADGSSEQRLNAVLRAGAVQVHITGSSDSAGADEVEFTVRGQRNSWRLTNWYEYSTAERGGPWTPGLSPQESSGPAAYGAQLDQVASLVSGQEQTLATFAEALQVQRIVEAMLDMADPIGAAG